MEKAESQLLGLGMGLKNSVPNPTWEFIYKILSGKSWEWEVPLMPSLLEAGQPDATPLLGNMNTFHIHKFKLLA